jgi:Tfp pilus assembly major pilin PilA
MAVNLIDSTDIEITQTGDNIQLSTTVDIQTLESNVSTNTSNIENLQNNIESLQTYSTSEVNTGKVWIDGKPIYRKVVQTTMGSTINSWNKIVNLSIDTLTRKDGFWVSGTDKYPIERSYNNEEITIYYNQNGIYEKHNYTFVNNKNATLILEYTKTTD